MIVTPSKEKLIIENFIEYSFDNDNYEFTPDFEIFKKLNSTDQYFLAENYNWDDGIEVLNWIINSPKCDKGTATLIFWRAEPRDYTEFNAENVGESEKEVFDLLQNIISKIKSRVFKKSRFEFIPSEYDVAQYKSNFDIWNLPNELKTGNKGILPISLSKIKSIIWNYQRNRRLKKRENRKTKRKKTSHNTGYN
ncbi:DUF4274 domain-containing protein [Cellulophaga omnivescoria]|uniref:DUF4274 domain-containing protein n=1 Tax=Cellulophaga omnivescoria TaxID=1888890 RepID=UPI0022F079D2|nr:DUF4274 domain-containing protein [Cellulophaga omnivescoria]WBU90809.1 DUF4274 domain-containing protein [Cellulophaga omnivescoria]